MATYLRSQEQAKLLDESVVADADAVKIVILQYKTGAVNFNTYVTIAQNLVTQQNLAAQAHGQIPTGLIAVYRALGGGWEIGQDDDESATEPAATETAPAPIEELENVPAPLPTVPEETPAIKKSDFPKKPDAAKKSHAAKKSTATESTDMPKEPDAPKPSDTAEKPADKKSEPAAKADASALKTENVLGDPDAES